MLRLRALRPFALNSCRSNSSDVKLNSKWAELAQKSLKGKPATSLIWNSPEVILKAIMGHLYLIHTLGSSSETSLY